MQLVNQTIIYHSFLNNFWNKMKTKLWDKLMEIPKEAVVL